MSTAGVPANRLRASGDSASGETWWVSVERAYTDLNPQDRDIVTERCSIGTTAPLTLEEVGRIYGITRERVRQIVAKIPTRLSMLPGVVEAANTLAGVLGDGASFAKLAGAGFDPADPLVALLLELVRGQKGSHRSWLVKEPFGVRVLTMNRDFDPRKFPMAAFDAADDDGDEVVNDLDTFQLMLAARCRAVVADSEVAPFMMALLIHCDTLQFVDGALVRWDGSYEDKAIRVLRAYQRTMPLAELDQIVAPGRPRAVTARVQSREIAGRIVRAADNNYGLPEWDWLEPYVELGPAMQQAIVDNGGRISLRRLQRVVAAAGFSPNSVVLYAQMHPVFVFEDDVVRLRGEDEPASTKPIECSAHCYRMLAGEAAGQWSFVTAVNYEDLRAASLIVPGAFGALLGLRPGERDVTLYADRTKLHASWTMSPYIWSAQLKKLLLARGAVDGQILRVIFRGPGNVVLELDDPVPVDGSPVVKIAKVIGLGSFTDIEDVVQGLAQAIGLDEAPSGADIIRRLQDRGETSMRDLLLEIVPELSEAER